jgi:hypothetical protein
MVQLRDVNPTDARGTSDDPYVASGRVFGGCYIYSSNSGQLN